jgi:DNA-binding response OmpR family regulator
MSSEFERSVAPRGPARGQRKLLVVDDEPAVARFLAHAADECGWQASICLSADAFRTEYESSAPDAVLLDLSLPGGDGIELLKHLARRKASALIIVVSGLDHRILDAAMRLGLALGLDMGPPLTKPVMVRQLAEALAHSDGGRKGTGNELCLGA